MKRESQDRNCPDRVALSMRQKALIPSDNTEVKHWPVPETLCHISTLLETIIPQPSWLGPGFPRLVGEHPQKLLPIG